MESGDGNISDKTAIVQQFLNTLLDHVIHDVEEAKTKQIDGIVHEMIIDALRRAFSELAAEEDKITSSTENKFTIQENLNKQNISNETPERNETDEEGITEENITTSVPTQDPYVVTDDAYSKSVYLEGRVSLYANLIKRPEGQEKKQATDVRRSVRDMIADFALNACKEEDKRTRESTFKNERKLEMFGPIYDVDHMQRCNSGSDVSSFTKHLEDCANRYRCLHIDSISSLRAECIEHSSVNKLTDIKILDKTDELKEEVFPKFSKVKKIKTKYGKVKIHYSDALRKEEREILVKEAEEMLKVAKQKKLEDKKIQKEVRNEKERSFGGRIGDFFRRLSCCKINTDE